MRIAIISIYPFPIGLAATNRILAYSKGMVENGASVEVIMPFPTDTLVAKKSEYGNSGNYEGVEYFYATGRFTNKYKIIRGISWFSGYRILKGLFFSFFKIKKKHHKNPYDCIIISTDNIVYLKLYSSLGKKLKIASIFIFDEYPIPIRHKLKRMIPLWKKLSYKFVLKNISAYISISEELKNYFNQLCEKQSFTLPVIVDISRFNNKKSDIGENEEKYICYMGNMELSKDNVDLIIKAFEIISFKYPAINFYLFGNPKSGTKKYLVDLVDKLKLSKRVFIKGKVNSDEVAHILKGAHILASSQPKTLRASGGFPTKLGEYLASGIPALLTDVGENSKYVKDNEHIFFCKPDDPVEYAKKIEYIIENYELARKVAENGRKFIQENYSHTKKGKELLEFILKLKFKE